MENPTKKCKQCQSDIPIKAKKCPQCHTDLRSWINRHPILSFFGIIILFGIFISSNSKTPTPDPVPTTSNISMVFDVPSLVPYIGKDIEELTAIMGTPNEGGEPTDILIQFSEDRTWSRAWYKSGYSFGATYNFDTRKIIDLSLLSESDASLVTFRDKNNILKVGNLSTVSDQYSVEFIKLRAILGTPKENTPDGFTGAIIRNK